MLKLLNILYTVAMLTPIFWGVLALGFLVFQSETLGMMFICVYFFWGLLLFANILLLVIQMIGEKIKTKTKNNS